LQTPSLCVWLSIAQSPLDKIIVASLTSLLQVPKYLELVQIFCARPKIDIHIVASPKLFCARPKDYFHLEHSVFVQSQFFYCAAPNAIQFLVWLKIFGPVQNILGPVE